MRKASIPLVAMLVVTLALVGAAAPATQLAAGDASARVEVGKVLAHRAESPHPYPARWSDILRSPGATFLRVHFVDFGLAPGDTLTVASPDGSQVWSYTGRGPHDDGDFWSFAVDGDAVRIEIQGGGRGFGYRISEIGHGTVDLRRDSPAPLVVCGTDGREGIACHLDDPIISATQKPAARLLFTSGGVQYLCTGQLVAGANDSTLITCNHCLSKQIEVRSLQATFNYQYTTCGGTIPAPTSVFMGGRLLKTNSEAYTGGRSGLDYTLLTLKGNPEVAWGELIPTTKAATVGERMNFIQHPGGNQKKIGYWEDADHAVRCKVDTINATYGNSAPNSQIGYGCDSEGGASGSAITDAATGHIIGLHHYGGVASSPCLNSGTAMTRICKDAGALLSCVSD